MKKMVGKFVRIEESCKNNRDLYFGFIEYASEDSFTAIVVESPRDADQVFSKDFECAEWVVKEYDRATVLDYFRMAVLKSTSNVSDAIFNLIEARARARKTKQVANVVFNKEELFTYEENI